MELVSLLEDKSWAEALVPLLKALVLDAPENIPDVPPYRKIVVPKVADVKWSLWTGTEMYGLSTGRCQTEVHRWITRGSPVKLFTIKKQPKFRSRSAKVEPFDKVVSPLINGELKVIRFSDVTTVDITGTIVDTRFCDTEAPDIKPPSYPDGVESYASSSTVSLPYPYSADIFYSVCTIPGVVWNHGESPNLIVLKKDSQTILNLLVEDGCTPFYADDSKIVVVEKTSTDDSSGCYERLKFTVYHYRHFLGRASEYFHYSHLIPLCLPVILIDFDLEDGYIMHNGRGHITIYDFRI